MSNETYITPPREPEFQGKFPIIDRWMQRATELINQISDGIDVNIQDQTTPLFIIPMNQKVGSTTLATATSKEDQNVIVADATGIIVGHTIILANAGGNVYQGKVVSIASAPTLVLDTPINAIFPIATAVNYGITNLAVDGSVTTQVFSVKNISPDIPIAIDVTRIIFGMITLSAVDLSTFGDLPALTNGIVLRKNDGEIVNFFNIKKNGGFATVAFDYSVFAATNPSQGVDGLVCRLTFGGQNKMGVVIRLEPDEDLEILIQDDLSGLTEFSIAAEGHVVDP